MPHAIDCFGITDRGRVRESNEDQFLIADLDKAMLVRQSSLADADHARMFGGSRGHLLVVADGIGGAAGGKRASGLAVQAVTRFVLDTMPWFLRLRSREDDAIEDLKEALEASRSAVSAAAASERGRERMGTTLTLAYVLWPRLFVVHAGDSRAYLYRKGQLHLITRDHTVAQKMVDEGQLSPGAIEKSPWSHVLYKCIGTGQADLNPDVFRSTLEDEDLLLLCTDGLTGPVPEKRIAELLDDGRAEDAARRLTDEALAAGAPDNVTVVVARFPGVAPG
jgi:protein phosphatase